MKKTENRLNAPMYNALMEYCSRDTVPFHMPGHKQGAGLPKEFFELIPKLDLTEIYGLDNLHFPKGSIKKAEELLAQAFRAEYSYFLVNGSTSGILTAIMAVCKPGKKVLVQRHCHGSVANGLTLAGAEPVFILSGIVEEFNVPDGIDIDKFSEVIAQNPDAAAVIVTRPSYYGICSNLKAIVDKAHSYGVPVIVDEAHGAHLGFADFLPRSAMDLGADISIQSAHKTLPALTQSSYAHLQGTLIDRERFEHYLRVFQSTSPSYILMAGLDICREIMEKDGRRQLEQSERYIDSLLKEFKGHPYIRILNRTFLSRGNEHDKTRLVVNMRSLGLDGYKLLSLLYHEYNIQPEMADLENVVCIATMSDTRESFIRLTEALLGIAETAASRKNGKAAAYGKGIIDAECALSDIRMPGIPERVISLREAAYAKYESIPVEHAAGRVNRNMLVPYPPGIPLVWPGERVTEEALKYIRRVYECGGRVNGLSNALRIDVVLDE